MRRLASDVTAFVALCNLGVIVPPDGENKIWWARLKRALGTNSSDVVNASLLQLQAAANLPSGGISEVGMNAALALIEGAAPRDEIEGALAVQMACTHSAALSVLARFRGGGGSEGRVAALATAAARLLRAFSVQVENFSVASGTVETSMFALSISILTRVRRP